MKAKTEEFLYLVLWTCDTICRPTLSNLTESFEGWAYRNGLLKQIRRLEKRKWLEANSDPAPNCERLYRLTEIGRLQALGGRDPSAQWERAWDGHWRMAIFDVPESRKRTRDKLRRTLRGLGFGCLQKSVWITPDPVPELDAVLANSSVEVESFILFEGRPCAGESDAQIVASAWDFPGINQAYAHHNEVLSLRPRAPLETEAAARAFQRWLRQERESWQEAVDRDPLLPGALLPASYAGRKAWVKRQQVMTQAGAQMRGFQAPAGQSKMRSHLGPPKK